MSNLIQYIQNEFDGIWNTNNLEAVMERFSDDAVVRSIPRCPVRRISSLARRRFAVSCRC